MQLEQLYRQVIMDHYKSPRNRGEIKDKSLTVNLNNPTCGDRISLSLQIKNNVIFDLKFTGDGCAISMASASMMTEAIKGKTTKEALNLLDQFLLLMQGNEAEFGGYEDVAALSGVCQFPARLKCANLAWDALAKGLQIMNKREDEKDE